MANKAISELPQALNVNNQDLFVLEQSGIAKKLTAETFITEQGIIDALAEALDGHGGISSVTLSSVSGRIRTYLITFTDGTSTTFQVLDGNTIDRIAKTSTAGLTDTYTVFMSDGTTSFFQVRNGQDGSATWDQINSKAPIITETVTGAIVNFPDGADDIPVADLVVNIEPVQSGSGDPSPDNIRPISGWTACNVTRTGKNLWDESDLLNCNGWAVSSGVYTGGSVSLISEYGLAPGGVPVTFEENTQYTVSLYGSATASAKRFWVFFLYTDGTRSSVEFNTTSLIKKSLTSTSGKSIRTMYFSRDTSGDVSIKEFQLELGSTATAYEPYQGTTLTVDWTTEAGTVYGGTIDVATGLLTVTNGYIASYNGETLPSTWISDRDVYAAGATPTIGAQIVYKLATPQTYPLTPQEVRTLLGTNNIFSDCSSVEVEYRADTKLYIEKLTMPTEDDMVANQAITSGKYFMIGNSLYLALANIASGAQITIGTNAQRVSLADALNTINS